MKTRFGEYGGQYVPEVLMNEVNKVAEAFEECKKDREFQDELHRLFVNYTGRPSMLYEAENMEKDLGGPRIFLKREDLNHTGAHKINNCIGQALLAKRMGKTRLIAETGAGQHGVAAATIAALFGMECEVFMGEIDTERQALNVYRMKLLGAKVHAVKTGSRVLKDAVNAATAFDEALGIDGVVLTKLDGDARGGAALSIRAATGKPIKFMGTGEKLDMIEPFHPDRMAQRILGMGDVLSFIERAEQSIDEEKAKKLEEKLKKNRFTLSDYYDQLVQLKSMGSFEQLAGMMPGQLGKQMANAELDPKMMAHTEAIILSMTPYERENPAVLGASRKKRIAAGCGLEVVDVNRLLKQFEMMQSMIKQVTRGGKMPKGMGGFGGGRMRGFGRKKRFK